MKLPIVIVSMSLAALAGCTDTTTAYQAQAQAPQPTVAQTVQRGTIIAVRTVRVPGNKDSQVGGAIVGGLVGAAIGSQIGKGDGKTLATGAGAIGGAIAGSNLANGAQPHYAREWTVRLQGGGRIAIIQNDPNLYVGQHVRVIQDSNGTRIVP